MPPKQAPSTTAESNTNAPSNNVVPPKRQRSKNFDLSDSVLLLEKVEKHGFGRWDVILQSFHRKHRLTHIERKEHSKLGKTFSYIYNGGGPIHNDKEKEFSIPAREKKKMTDHEKLDAQRKFNAEVAHERQLKQRGRDCLKRIKDSQIVGDSAESPTAQIAQQKEAQNARQQARDNKYNEFIAKGKEEQAFRTKIIEELAETRKELKRSADVEADLLREMTEYYKAKRAKLSHK